MDQIYVALRKFLANRHVASDLDNTASGERNLRVDESTTLAVFVEIYHEGTGDHECVPLTELLGKLVEGECE